MTNPNLADTATWKVISPPLALPPATADALLKPWRGSHRACFVAIAPVDAMTAGASRWVTGFRRRADGSRWPGDQFRRQRRTWLMLARIEARVVLSLSDSR